VAQRLDVGTDGKAGHDDSFESLRSARQSEEIAINTTC
jgi:hypothetical protein